MYLELGDFTVSCYIGYQLYSRRCLRDGVTFILFLSFSLVLFFSLSFVSKIANQDLRRWHLASREAEQKSGEHAGWARRSGSNHRYITDHMCAGAKTFMLSTSNPASSEFIKLILAPSTL